MSKNIERRSRPVRPRMRDWFLPTLLLATTAGCQPALPPGVPRNAALVSELTVPIGARESGFVPLQSDVDGIISIYDVALKRIVFSDGVPKGTVLRLYQGKITTLGSMKTGDRRSAERETSLVQYHPGRQYRVYFSQESGKAKPAEPATQPASEDESPREIRRSSPGIPIQKK